MVRTGEEEKNLEKYLSQCHFIHPENNGYLMGTGPGSNTIPTSKGRRLSGRD
jgi:hypothetical protein